MKDRLTITITDVNGSKHYTTHKIAQKLALYLASFLFVVIAIGITMILVLQSEVSAMEDKKVEIQQEVAQLLNENTGLKLNVADKAEELDVLSLKLDDIEELVGLKYQGHLDVASRIELASLTSAEKAVVFQNIPSGSPLGKTIVTSHFGKRIHPLSGVEEKHGGVDLRAKMNTEVFSTADGVVEYAAPHKKSGYGKLLIISHNYGFKTFYGHLNGFEVKQGDFIQKGDLVALSGNSGKSSAPHLHYEIRYIQRRADPMSFIQWDMQSYESIFSKEKYIKWPSLVQAITRPMFQLPQQLLQTAQK